MTNDDQNVGATSPTAKRQHLIEGASATGLPKLIDSEALAQSLDVPVRHIRRLVDERRIPFVKIGRYVRFDVDEVTAWVEVNRVGQFRQMPTQVRSR